MLCLKTNWKIAASRPTCRVAVLETTIDCASIILPMTPPLELADAIRIGLMPSLSAVTFWRLPKSALEPASVPVRATPSQPSRVPKKGKAGPVRVRLRPRTVSMPEYRVTIGQADHEADRQQRRDQVDDRLAEDPRDPARAHSQDQRRQDRAQQHGRAGQREMFRSAIASSGVGSGTNRRHRARPRDARRHRLLEAIEGQVTRDAAGPTKMKTETSRNGDQPLSTAAVEWRRSDPREPRVDSSPGRCGGVLQDRPRPPDLEERDHRQERHQCGDDVDQPDSW